MTDPQASYGYNNKNSHINSLQTSLTTSPDLADPQTPPNRYLALPDVSPAGYSYASHASSPGLSGVRSDTDTDADQPLFAQSHTSTRYYTGYSVSPNALPVVGQSASARKGKGKTSLTPSMLADGEAEMGGGSAAMLQEEEGRDEMRDLLEGKIRTAALNTAGQMQSLSHKVPAPRTPTAGPYAQHAPSRNTAPTFTPSRMVSGPQLQKDPMMVIQQCMADADRFLRALQRFNTPTTRPPDTSSPDIKGVTPQAAHSNLGTTGTMHVPEDEALADHLHKLTLRERKLDERQREMEKLAERWEEARYGEGQELDFTELRDAGVGDVVGLPGGSSGLNLAKPSALNRVKSMSFAPSPLSGNTSPSASTAVMTEMSIPSQLAPIISDPLQPTLSTLSETLHAQSSLLISTGRQLRAIRQAITTAQEGLKNEDRALRGIEGWEAERVREGLRGGKRSDGLKGIGEGLEGVWEGQRARLEGLAFGSGLEGGRRGAGSALMG